MPQLLLPRREADLGMKGSVKVVSNQPFDDSLKQALRNLQKSSRPKISFRTHTELLNYLAEVLSQKSWSLGGIYGMKEPAFLRITRTKSIVDQNTISIDIRTIVVDFLCDNIIIFQLAEDSIQKLGRFHGDIFQQFSEGVGNYRKFRDGFDKNIRDLTICTSTSMLCHLIQESSIDCEEFAIARHKIVELMRLGLVSESSAERPQMQQYYRQSSAQELSASYLNPNYWDVTGINGHHFQGIVANDTPCIHRILANPWPSRDVDQIHSHDGLGNNDNTQWFQGALNCQPDIFPTTAKLIYSPQGAVFIHSVAPRVSVSFNPQIWSTEQPVPDYRGDRY